MQKVFVNDSQIEQNTVTLHGQDARHIALSLRMAIGDILTVCDGSSNDYICKLDKIHPDEVVCTVISSRKSSGESPVRITLYQGMAKGERMDYIVQKSTELGVSRIVPVITSRCVARPDGASAEKKLERYRRIAREAAMQSGRGSVPEISVPVTFAESLSQFGSHSLSLFCYEEEKNNPLPAALPAVMPADIGIFIGPEGGFSEQEASQAITTGAAAISLGPRILRTETAPVYVLSCISFRYEF